MTTKVTLSVPPGCLVSADSQELTDYDDRDHLEGRQVELELCVEPGRETVDQCSQSELRRAFS